MSITLLRLFILLFLSITNLWAQCNIHLYQCSKCGQNSIGTNSPSNGKYCSGRSNSSAGHSWRDEGLTPECQKQYDEVTQRRSIECEKNKMKIFHGATVIDWYCPSGKPSQVKYANGVIEDFNEDGIRILKDTPKSSGYWREFFENEKVVAKGYINSNGLKDGEWYFESYISSESCQKCFVQYHEGAFSGIGSKEQVAHREIVKNIEQEYRLCSTIEDFEKFRTKYPDSPWDSEAIVQIRKLKREEQELVLAQKKEDEFLNPLIMKWESLPDTSLTFSFFNEYYKQFPEGYRTSEVHEMLERAKQKIGTFMDALHQKHENDNKDLLVIPEKIRSEQAQYNKVYLDKSTDNFGVYDELFKRYPQVEFPKLDEWLKQQVVDKRIQYKFQIDYLIQLNTETSLKVALSMLNVIDRYSSSIHNSAALPFNIQKCLLNWRFNDMKTLFNEIEAHKNDVIDYSNGSVKYAKKFKELYKDYKMDYPNEKENWNKISNILNI